MAKQFDRIYCNSRRRIYRNKHPEFSPAALRAAVCKNKCQGVFAKDFAYRDSAYRDFTRDLACRDFAYRDFTKDFAYRDFTKEFNYRDLPYSDFAYRDSTKDFS